MQFLRGVFYKESVMKNASIAGVFFYVDETAEDGGGVACEIAPGMKTTADHENWKPIHNGPGACQVDNCGCSMYYGNGISPCSNPQCGHTYALHGM
jgi:hypothetical protein